MKSYWTQCKPMTAIGLINKILTATGSTAGALSSEFADFNGHHITVSFNDYKEYWIAYYYWAGRRVLARGSFSECVGAALDANKTNGEGGCVVVYCQNEEQVAACKEANLFEHSEEAEKENYDSLLDPKIRDEAINAAHLHKHIPQDFSKFAKKKET